ncbi:MAG TPA: Sua5 family C-terminal domain-containing protein, partial [Acidimicrobiales bacterium]|nr:Sua5 family C-terminal domain-containing protein [Acidimicrobiales bacterium]
VAEALGRAAAHAGAGRRVGVLAPGALPELPGPVVALEPLGDAETAARVLYARLREADALGLDVLVVVPPEPEGIGEAVLDRLRRAAAGR